MADLAIIIPVFNEEKRIQKLFRQLQVFEIEKAEIIFVDGGSQDQTYHLIQAAGYSCIKSSKGRGNQLHAGVEATKAPRILFLHADSYFKESPLSEIVELLNRGSIGAFRLRFENPKLLMRWIAYGSNWRLRKRQIAFGDQGIFVTRDYYYQVGGFLPIPLMEDYDFSLRSKEKGQPLMIAKVYIYTSARRFEQGGNLKTLLKMQYCQHLFRKGVPIEKILSIYNN